MRFPGKATVTGLTLSLTAGTGWAAEVCARAPDLVALQVSALQQQLMVAALTCDDVSLYNSFVTTYQKDLVASDQALQAFFDRFGETDGAPAYHSFKTKMANIYSSRSAANKRQYCANARAAFGPAIKAQNMSLASFALSQPSRVSEPYTNCGASVAGGAMATGAPAATATPAPPPSNLLVAQNAAADAKGTAPPVDKPLTAGLTAPRAAAGAESAVGSTAAAGSTAATPPGGQAASSNTARSPYYQGYGVGYARQRERERQQQAPSAQANVAPPAATSGNSAATASPPNQERSVTGSARSQSASEAYRERLAQQRAARQRAAQRPSTRYRDGYDARGYFWPADPYWEYCYTRYGVRMSCAEAAQRYRANRYYYRAPDDAWGNPQAW